MEVSDGISKYQQERIRLVKTRDDMSRLKLCMEIVVQMEMCFESNEIAVDIKVEQQVRIAWCTFT